MISAQWQSVIGGRPEVERVLMRAALAAHQLIDPGSPPPEPRDTATAELGLQLAPLMHGFAVSGHASIQPEYDYLLTTMGSSRPYQQYVADALVNAAEADHAFGMWQPPALLVKAAHFAQGGRLTEALAGVDQAVARVRRLRSVSRATRESVLVAAEAARPVLEAATSRQPLPERRRAELDEVSHRLEKEALGLYSRDAFDAARECFDRAVALVEEWYAAFPGDARAIRALAITLNLRLNCLTEAGWYVEAVTDGRRALRLFHSLRSTAVPLVAIELGAIDVEARLALALAGAVEAGDQQVTGPDPAAAVVRHGTAAIEACLRLADQASASELAQARGLYAIAMAVLNDAQDGPDDDEVVLSAEREALDAYRSLSEQLAPHDRRYFAQIAFSHAISRLGDDPEAARAAAADFIEQAHQLLLVGLLVQPDADETQRLWEFGYAEYVLAYSSAQLGDESAGQHLVNAQHYFSHCPDELPESIAEIKRQVDDFIAKWRQDTREHQQHGPA